MPRHPALNHPIAPLALIVGAAGLTACAAKPAPSPTVAVAPGAYAATFEAAKDALRAYAFELDRVDASCGVLTTHARGSAGFATPWIPHSSSVGDAGQGFLDRERRRAVVVFEPIDPEGDEPSSQQHGSEDAPHQRGTFDPDFTAAIDRAEPVDTSSTLRARVMVWVERVYRPGRRVGSTSVRLASFTSDPELKEQGLEPAFSMPTRPDHALEARLAREIEARAHAAERR